MSSSRPSEIDLRSFVHRECSSSAFRYTKNCEKLLAKFTAAFRQIESEFPKIEDFVRKYKVRCRSQSEIDRSSFQLDCPAAILRIREGRPITVRDDRGNMGKSIAETVSVRVERTSSLLLSSSSVAPDQFDGQIEIEYASERHGETLRSIIPEFSSSSSFFQLQQDVRELLDVINRMNIVPANYIGREKIPYW